MKKKFISSYKRKIYFFLNMVLFLQGSYSQTEAKGTILKFTDFIHYFNEFNDKDNELYIQYVPNKQAISFLEGNIPLLDIPDSIIQQTYYFRWWTFRKHLKQTARGFVITEFLPEVPWSGKYNTINCPAAYHIYEGRWLHDDVYIKDYIKYWLSEADNVRKYSFWAVNSIAAFSKVQTDRIFLKRYLPALIDNYYAWENEHRDSPDRLFWQSDNYDGMELSAGGRVLNNGEDDWNSIASRPTINSYMYADASAISELANYLKESEWSKKFKMKAEQIKGLVEGRLWNDSLSFFTVLPRDYEDDDKPIAIRELIGYTPWYFNLPEDDPKYIKAWNKILDTTGFAAPFGLTTTERSHPYFEIKYEGHECQWNGPSWPFATTQVLKSFSNFLNNYKYNGNLTKLDYYQLLKQYAQSHRITWENGESQMWIDENINPFTGDWISRTRLKTWDNNTWSSKKGGEERGKDYNHSGFCDLIINDLIGFKPQLDGSIAIKPLVPDNWDWFCLDNVYYQGKILTVLWDKTGNHYKRGEGFQVFYNGNRIFKSEIVEEVSLKI